MQLYCTCQVKVTTSGFCHDIEQEKTGIVVKKQFDDMFTHFSTMHECARQTDRQLYVVIITCTLLALFHMVKCSIVLRYIYIERNRM